MQVGKHLTTITDTKGEGILAIKERSKLITHPVVKQDGLGPAFTSTQHITVGETATSHQTLELLQADATG